YKKKNGFQPLQMTWERFVVDAVFRGGSKHSNHGDTVEKMVRHIVRKIRMKYRSDVPIIIKMDSGFFDQKLFEVFEELHIGYVVSGKLYNDIKDYVGMVDSAEWKQYRNKDQVWDYVEFMDKRGSWTKARRALYCRPWYEDSQLVMDFARPDTILYTNLGMGETIDDLLTNAGRNDLVGAEKVIECAHGRGRDELVHRAFKDFGHEELPFKRFAPNAAYYYTMVLAFFLFETFKEDVCSGVIPMTAYATTVRRNLIDIAAKIVKKAGKIILKVTSATWNSLKFNVLWEKCGTPPRVVWA
ncbi:MAG: IS1380 family transposase, partial [Syntrophobacterales bacterium CG23_combo_of_CG06-09_8_20_14_all_48_27]